MPDSDLINDELERVYQLYGERQRQFRRGLYALIVAGLAVFALLVVPFLTFRERVAETRAEEQALAAALERAHAAVAEAEASVAALRGLVADASDFAGGESGLTFYRTIDAAAEEQAQQLAQLRQWSADMQEPEVAAWVRGETERPPRWHIDNSRLLRSLDQHPCSWKDGNAWRACRLCEEFQEVHAFNAHRLAALTALTEAERAAAAGELEAVVTRACGWLTGGALHWRRNERPEPEGRGSLQGMMAEDQRAYAEAVLALDGRLRDLVPARALEAERLERARAATTQRLAVLEAQLERIAGFDRLGTPVGDLPIGLGQLVLLFPVVLALGFVVVANGYVGTLGIWQAFVRLCRKRDAEGAVMDARHLAAIAPLWLDRAVPPGARAMQWLVMLAPLGLTLATLWLIVATGALAEMLPDDSAIPPWGYVLLYGASLALYAALLWHVWTSRRQAEDAA
ncbi:MAG: hypothetical protein ACM35H_15835 [Bacteroidota bacterium]|nr:hypothetical protein [Kiloniellaceae bacterium]